MSEPFGTVPRLHHFDVFRRVPAPSNWPEQRPLEPA